jgi:hypothetical protein
VADDLRIKVEGADPYQAVKEIVTREGGDIRNFV